MLKIFLHLIVAIVFVSNTGSPCLQYNSNALFVEINPSWVFIAMKDL